LIDQTKLSEAKEKYQKADLELISASKEFIIGSVQEFISKYAEIKTVQWAQYTPYFNDGDPCRFGVGQMGLEFHKDHFGALIDPRYHNYEDFQIYSEGHECYSNYSPRVIEIKNNFNQLGAELLRVAGKTSFEKIWGDHVRVTIDLNGDRTHPHRHD
jgi:hypothetical protein